MIKQLLSFAAIAAALTVNAEVVTLWEGECNFGKDWASDASFAVPASEFSVLDNNSAVLTFEYTLDSSCQWWQYKPCSNGEGWKPLEVATELGNSYQCISVSAGTTSTQLELKAADIATIKANGMRFQGYGMTFKKITYNAATTIDPNLLWEGEYEISGWNSGAEFASTKVKAGDVLLYDFSEAGTSSAQVLLKGSDYKNLLGAAKIASADLATKKVYVGVTKEMLDNCGGKIFVQGDGDCVLNKVSIVDHFDATGVVAYGERALGASIFTVIPEGTKELAVELTTANPEWIQLCNSSWTDLELANKKSADGKTYTFTLTDDAIKQFNEKKELIFNAPAGVSLSKVYIPQGESGVENIVAEADANAPVNVYNIAGQQVRANVAPAEAVEGLAPGFYIVGNKKVLVK